MWCSIALAPLACASDGPAAADAVLPAAAETEPPRDEPAPPPVAHGTCGALVAPWRIESADDVWAAMRFVITDLMPPRSFELEALARAGRAEGGAVCPHWASSTASQDYVYGPCTTSTGDEWSGAAVYGDLWAREPTEIFRFAFEDFSFRAADGSLSFQADGAVSHVYSEAPTVYEAAGFWTRLHHDGSYADPQGEWYRHEVVILERGTLLPSVLTSNSYTYVVEDPLGPTGDLCQSWDVVAAPSCLEEGDGIVTVDGTASAEVHFDGSLLCDGCVDVVIEGEPAGSVCPEEGLWPE